METTRTASRRRPLRKLTAALGLALIAALLLSGSAMAVGHAGLAKVAKPGRPTPVAPTGTITNATPTFTWTKAARASSYEVRVSNGGTLLLKKAGIRARSWTTSAALPENVNLSWKVRARNAAGPGAWSRATAFMVMKASSAKAVTSFSFSSPPATGVINEALHTIAVTVPSGTGLSALVPTIAITGASVSPASGVAMDFSSPVTYTVTAADGSTQAYVVTVTQQASAQAEVQIASFAFTPKTLTVQRGTTVVWKNNDSATHTVTSVDSLDLNATPTGLFDSGALSGGQTFSFTFTTPGTFFYECQIHSGVAAMHAQVNVE